MFDFTAEHLEPDRDPVDGRMVPCVFCMSSPQVGGTGVCSSKCEADLNAWVEDDDAWVESDNE